MLGVAKAYLGPAAPNLLSAEMHALGVNANTITPEHVEALAQRVRERAARVMSPEKANELADALARVQLAGPKAGSGHRLASDAASKLLISGKLRQAEKAYLELVQKHGDADSYAGLAHAQAALEDGDAALTTLREAAAKFAKAGDRATAVSLLAEAVALAPTDLAAHRRLAAALANQGDLIGAVEEYGRFVDVALAQHDSRRALLELAYGRETLGDLPGLVALVDRVTGTATAPHAKPAAPAPQPVKPAPATAPAPRPAPAQRAAAETTRPQPTPQREPTVRATIAEPIRIVPEAAAPQPRSEPLLAAVVVDEGRARTEPTVMPEISDGAVDILARAGVVKRKAAPRPQRSIEEQLAELMTTGTGIEAATSAASRAALLTGAHDVRATEAVLDAARRLLTLGKLQSASDVLLDFIGHGFTDREAQRLLIEVDCALGRRDVAREKCGLLSAAYRLDGRGDVAEDIERLAKIL